ncbi:hypothetical protein GCM10028818_60480 [Spirosoma horti]
MPVNLKVYANEDDTLLFWSIPQPIAQCRGFAIERTTVDPQNKKTTDFLPNRMGFENQPVAGQAVSSQPVPLRPSTEWPFQRFSWTDHDANIGDTVSYRIIPIIRTNAGTLERIDAEASSWSPERTLGAKLTGKYKPFFNRGFVMSQFMTHYLKEQKLTLDQFKTRIRDEDDKTIRRFLSGDLRVALLNELKTAQVKNGHIYAALFELNDDELIKAIMALGKRAHIVLSNGSITKGKTETMAQARIRDENEEARKRLMATGVDVEVEKINRFLSPGALGHNKFMVRTDDQNEPVTAWTGSTNWTTTGLCTQVNNGLLIEDTDVAKVYLDQWHQIKKAASGFPLEFVQQNNKPKQIGAAIPGQVRATVWFSRTQKQVDLTALRDEVLKAKQGILFLMFMPGATGLFSTVTAQSARPDLYVRGVVSELPNGRGDESAADVNLIDKQTHIPLHLDIIEPEGIPNSIAFFAEEVSRKQFLHDIGFAIIHSKVVVIDPFSEDPVVITGSHNFSGNASSKNDENFIIVKGDKELAEAYAVNILGAYDHYRYRSFINDTAKPFNGIKDNDTWQAPMLRSRQIDLRFWGV